jgi:hypothetical protein
MLILPLLAASLASVSATSHALAGPAPLIPPWSNCTLPEGVPLVGIDPSGQPDPMGACTVVIRDVGGNPLWDVLVIFDFTDCWHQVRIASVQPQPGVFVQCSQKSVAMPTDVEGRATISIVGKALPASADPILVRIGLEEAYLGSRPVVAYDLDGATGVGPNDLYAWFGDFFAGQSLRGDYDFDGGLGPNDLALWFQVFFGSGSVSSASAYCP